MNKTNCTSRKWSKIWLLLTGVILATLLLSMQVVHADIGPKPSMEFEFFYEIEGEPTIAEGQQMQCEEPDCADAKPLEELGPQRFQCTENACTSMAYGYTTYNQLVIRFSDGVTRESNVFKTGPSQSIYRVTVRADDLAVKRTGGHANPMLLIITGGLVGGVVAVAAGIAVLVVTVWLIVKAQQEAIVFTDARGLFIAAWVASVPLLTLSTLFSAAPLVTILVEGIIIFGYAAMRDEAHFPWLTQGVLENLVTQPALWFVIMSQRGNLPYFITVSMTEIVIWVAEAALLCLLRGRQLAFKRALALSLILNVVSFSVGILLPL